MSNWTPHGLLISDLTTNVSRLQCIHCELLQEFVKIRSWEIFLSESSCVTVRNEIYKF